MWGHPTTPCFLARKFSIFISTLFLLPSWCKIGCRVPKGGKIHPEMENMYKTRQWEGREDEETGRRNGDAVRVGTGTVPAVEGPSQ